MTLDEARKVAAICENADGGCSHCAANLCTMLQKTFPEFVWTFVPTVYNPAYEGFRIDVSTQNGRGEP